MEAFGALLNFQILYLFLTVSGCGSDAKQPSRRLEGRVTAMGFVHGECSDALLGLLTNRHAGTSLRKWGDFRWLLVAGWTEVDLNCGTPPC